MKNMDNLHGLAAKVLAENRALGRRIATAESCTGGLVAAALTAIAGSSATFLCGFVTYANEAKTRMLGVPEATLARHGAVSPEVALAMATGALSHSSADVAVAVTGIAGPGGGSAAKPVGMVVFARAARSDEGTPTSISETRYFADEGRDAIRVQAVRTALMLLRP